MTGLGGKVVVVTGGARGQGAAEVEALARAGATVVATDVLDGDGSALAARLEGESLDVRYAHLDVTSPDDWAALAADLRERHGRVDALVNNAGIAARERLPHVTLEAWHLAFEVNVTGPMLGIQALAPLMPAGSSIVNICSVAAMAGHAAAAYTASKWALRGLTRSASLELGLRGIRVNAVMPGLVDTPLMASASPAFTEAALTEIPLGRVGLPADIAPTIVFLVSDDSAYYNGAEIVIDGGLSAHVSHKRIADATRPPEEDRP
ncbi:3alpha(or 20beta)-hydroxysteroid dehydrogenase [Humibacillus xanthopallidus]|uniref:3alpha(Or 20beta)-hydroxysteroid dehydrogenase n=1 Tax=Humibacillus xanthopallidus TaxID=412689 RepID=A0A543PUL3_9MICO|nr:SDR family oxidoreductase [Humibacillus xanthopallidus]TQN47772.1 3alpha(or 20beta)-hydroxysteroid dehydrogenase [Humibacillus xanthopallidus]